MHDPSFWYYLISILIAVGAVVYHQGAGNGRINAKLDQLVDAAARQGMRLDTMEKRQQQWSQTLRRGLRTLWRAFHGLRRRMDALDGGQSQPPIVADATDRFGFPLRAPTIQEPPDDT
jgi:hypothetical protein